MLTLFTKEIRIGNWVKFCGNNNLEVIFPVSGISDNHVIYSHYHRNELPIDNIQPIRLNPEWIKKFGFESGTKSISGDEFFIQVPSKSNSTQVTRKFRLWEANNSYYLDLEQFGYGNKLKLEIHYVHLLQNLYFSLTGVELEIKDDYLQGFGYNDQISIQMK